MSKRDNLVILLMLMSKFFIKKNPPTHGKTNNQTYQIINLNPKIPASRFPTFIHTKQNISVCSRTSMAHVQQFEDGRG